MTPKQKRRASIVVGITMVAFLSIGLLVYASRGDLNLYYSPEQVQQGEAPIDKTIRVGGLVVPGSYIASDESLAVKFDVIDGSQEKINIIYDGILPDLFREGQGIIAKGKLQEDKTFIASEILAKHDEKYMPPEVAATLKDADHFFSEDETQ